MTTDLRATKLTANDVFKTNDILNLSRHSALDKKIAAISFVTNRPSHQTPWSDVLRCSIDSALAWLSQRNVGKWKWRFFGATDGWRESTAVARHKKFWGAYEALKSRQSLKSSPEVLFQFESKIRFAVIADLESVDVPLLAEWTRARRSGLLFLSQSPGDFSDSAARTYFEALFRNRESEVDWSLAVSKLCDADSILVRCSGAFDDPDASVDLLYAPLLIQVT